MPDLSTALRDHVDGLAPPVRFDEVVVRRPQRNRPPFLLVAAALLVVIGLVAVALQSDDEGEQLAAGEETSSADALRNEGTATEIVQAWDYGLTIADPETRAERYIGGPSISGFACPSCAAFTLGQSLYVAGQDGVYRLDPPDFASNRIADGNIAFPGSAPDELYVATARSGSPHGTDLHRVTSTGADRGGPWPIPEGYWLTSPARATARGVILESPPNSFEKTFTVWDPATGAMGPLGRGTRVIDTHVADGSTVVSRTIDDCSQDACLLAVTDTASGRTREIQPPGDDLGYLGGGGFSPDGTKLAAFSVSNIDTRSMRLVMIDVATGAATPIAKSNARFGEGYGFATWSADGRWVFFGGLDEFRAHRVGAKDAVKLSLGATYSAVAVVAGRGR